MAEQRDDGPFHQERLEAPSVVNLESVQLVASSGIESSKNKLSAEEMKRVSESLQPVMLGNTSLVTSKKSKDSKGSKESGSHFSINLSNKTESEGGLPADFDPLIQNESESETEGGEAASQERIEQLLKRPEKLRDRAYFFSRKEYLKLKNQVPASSIRQNSKADSETKMEEAEMNFFEQEEHSMPSDPAYDYLKSGQEQSVNSKHNGMKWHYFWWAMKLSKSKNPYVLAIFSFQIWVVFFVILDIAFTYVYIDFYAKYLALRFGPQNKDPKTEDEVIKDLAARFLEKLYMLKFNEDYHSDYYIKMGKNLAFFSFLTLVGFFVKTLSGVGMIKNKFRARHVNSYFQLAFTLNCAFFLQYQEQYFALSKVFEASFQNWIEQSVLIFLPLLIELWLLSNFVRRLDQDNNIYNVLTRNRKVSYQMITMMGPAEEGGLPQRNTKQGTLSRLKFKDENFFTKITGIGASQISDDDLSRYRKKGLSTYSKRVTVSGNDPALIRNKTLKKASDSLLMSQSFRLEREEAPGVIKGDVPRPTKTFTAVEGGLTAVLEASKKKDSAEERLDRELMSMDFGASPPLRQHSIQEDFVGSLRKKQLQQSFQTQQDHGMRVSINSDDPPSFKPTSELAAIAEAEESGIPQPLKLSINEDPAESQDESENSNVEQPGAADTTQHALFANSRRLNDISMSSRKSQKQLQDEQAIEVVENGYLSKNFFFTTKIKYKKQELTQAQKRARTQTVAQGREASRDSLAESLPGSEARGTSFVGEQKIGFFGGLF